MKVGETDGEVAGRRPGPVMGDAGWAVVGPAVGLAAGVGGTVLIRRAAARQGAGPPREEPRQEVIDLDLRGPCGFVVGVSPGRSPGTAGSR